MYVCTQMLIHIMHCHSLHVVRRSESLKLVVVTVLTQNHHHCKLEGPTTSTIRTNRNHIAEAQPSDMITLTRRNEGVLDCIALDEGAQVIIRTLDDMCVQSSYIINSSNGCCVFCSSYNSVHCTREGIDKDFTTLHCPIVYPQWGCAGVTVSTDEGELV